MKKLLLIIISLFAIGFGFGAENFHYQLQNTKYSTLSQLKNTYIVIDIDDSGLTKDQISNLKKNGNIVLSYLSIGEAEDYRSYWQTEWKQNPPSFLDKENPDWKGNYKVKYWDKDWQDIILSKVDEIKSKGFDGVYLDIIDAYYYYEQQGKSDAAPLMIDFVERIKNKGNLIVIGQNGLDLVGDQRYVNTIDGVGVEDLWTNGNKKQSDTEYRMNFLDKVQSNKKLVLSIDYPTNQTLICNYYKNIKEKGYIGAVFNRNLSISAAKICNTSTNNTTITKPSKEEKKKQQELKNKINKISNLINVIKKYKIKYKQYSDIVTILSDCQSRLENKLSELKQ